MQKFIVKIFMGYALLLRFFLLFFTLKALDKYIIILYNIIVEISTITFDYRKEKFSVEQIYTIPVNEAFDLAVVNQADHSLSDTCPLCALYSKLEDKEIDLILGASMMEPDVRIKTNEKGFCRTHYDMMFMRKNRLGMALTLESHLNDLRKEIQDNTIIGTPGKKPVNRIDKLESDCYICGKVNFHFGNMIETVIFLWESDESFREKFSKQPYFCLSHYKRLIECGRARLSKKRFSEFFKAIQEVELAYFDALCTDVSWFCKKFDYRYEDEPWNNSKDAVERAIKFLRSDIHK